MSAIHAALVSAMRDICKIGIGKTKTASTGAANYKFRGVEDAMNEMSPILVNHGITVTPSYSELSISERAKDGGKATRFCTIKGAFRFEASDGSHVISEAYGEAMDSGDKATIKAQSVAFRTALFQQFIVPTVAMDTELHGEGESQMDTYLAAIGAAPTVDELQTVYKEAFKLFSKDQRAQKEVIAAKDKRKQELVSA